MADANGKDSMEEKDDRISCKYGEKCYQKNKEHLKKFKHPKKPEKQVKDPSNDSECPPAKKLKLDTEDLSPKTKDVENEDSNPSTIDSDTANKSTNDENEDCDAEEEEVTLIPMPSDKKEAIKLCYLVEMPEDFYDLWNFLKKLDSTNPSDALKKYGIVAVGPFDILSGKLKSISSETKSEVLCHWRFYYDPPEFQTVMAANQNEYRIGYFRDDPSKAPVFTASMTSLKNGVVTPLGGNIFAALKSYLDSKLNKIDLFKKAELTKCIKSLESFAKEKSYSLEAKTAKMKERQKKVVTKSFHGAGIVVPVDKKTDVGYREIPETDADLRKILTKVVDSSDALSKKKNLATVQELMTNSQWATDEGDFGMALELGLDLFAFGGEDFHSFIKHLLTVSYDLLDRKVFGTIIEAHLKNRRKGHFECT